LCPTNVTTEEHGIAAQVKVSCEIKYNDELVQYREKGDEPSYDSMLEAQKTEFWVERYTEDQARNYFYLLDKAIDVDYIITNELWQSFAQAYFVTSCKEIYKNRVSVKAADGWWALDSRTASLV
jgi:hypothetical protein